MPKSINEMGVRSQSVLLINSLHVLECFHYSYKRFTEPENSFQFLLTWGKGLSSYVVIWKPVSMYSLIKPINSKARQHRRLFFWNRNSVLPRLGHIRLGGAFGNERLPPASAPPMNSRVWLNREVRTQTCRSWPERKITACCDSRHSRSHCEPWVEDQWQNP